ncbi:MULTISPECIES: CoA transferase subunit A [Sporosarcina]|uniref:CoA transferase subunit A n=1 Tax=Sporosarcina TaxID=1569 RepID=UPI00099ACA12|nr:MULTISPECIES: CoA transferase subunit A [Sporosarcina]MBY0221807.1 CoA transferase subunit A [Sporosarcina aquimarina]
MGVRKLEKLKTVDELEPLFKDRMRLLVGGFGISGTPLTVLHALPGFKAGDYEVVSNNLGDYGKGLHKVFEAGKIAKAIGSFFTINKEAVTAWSKGELAIDLLPQGTLAEAIRCGGAGIGGFYTPTAVGTKLAEGKEVREIDGVRYLFEKAIKGDLALIKAAKADKAGNLIYHTTARNFNPVMATAAATVIAEVDEIVEIGELRPEEIITPHIYVDYVVKSKYVKKGDDYVEVN